MLAELIDGILYHYPWYLIAGLTTAWFLLLYFVLGPLFLAVARLLHRAGYVRRIIEENPAPHQITYEIRHSLLSIFLFGFSALPLVWLVRSEHITLLPDTAWNVAWGLAALTLWNEVHFYLIHSLMHRPWCMRHIHRVHHRSRIPTTWSVFSFHPLEAALLSTVPLTIVPWLPLSPLAIILFPLVSILLNFAGHANFRFGKGTGSIWTRFSTRHATHHSGTSKDYGFASHLPHQLCGSFKKN